MNNQIIKRKVIPISCNVVKTGKSSREGREWKWTLYRIQAVVLPSQKSQQFSSFDDFTGRLNIEVEVEIETKVVEKDGKTYTNYNISLPKRNMWYEVDTLTIRLEALERKLNANNSPTTSADEPSLGDEDKEANPEDAYNNEGLPF